MTKRIGIYPGTFDPMTKGHLHIIERASRLVDHLIVGIATHPSKTPLFTLDERIEIAKTDVSTIAPNIEVTTFSGLLVEFAKNQNAGIIFRGLRSGSDFDFEYQMTGMNTHLAPQIETVFLMSNAAWQFVSSSFIKEIAAYGGNIEDFVTKTTCKKILAANKQSS